MFYDGMLHSFRLFIYFMKKKSSVISYFVQKRILSPKMKSLVLQLHGFVAKQRFYVC